MEDDPSPGLDFAGAVEFVRATVGLLNALDLEPFPKDALVGDGLDGVFIGFLASRDEEDLVGFACVFGPFREALPVYNCRSTGRGDAEATSPDLADPFASGVVRWAFCAAPLRSSSAFRFTDPRVIFVLVGVVEAVDGLGFSPVIDASKSLICCHVSPYPLQQLIFNSDKRTSQVDNLTHRHGDNETATPSDRALKWVGAFYAVIYMVGVESSGEQREPATRACLGGSQDRCAGRPSGGR